MKRTVVVLLLLLVPCTLYPQGPVQSGRVMVGLFSSNDLTGWNEKVFDQATSYRLTQFDDEIVLQAISHNAASGLFKKISIDIKKYPYLNWRWRIETRFSSMDETQKNSDDYAARIYLVVSGGLFFWQTKALNYVWSSQAKREDSWPNAFAPDNTRMVAVRTMDDQTGTWYSEKRNVYEALKSWLGEEVQTIDAVAIMTDSDNTGGQAVAFYGDIYFSKE